MSQEEAPMPPPTDQEQVEQVDLDRARQWTRAKRLRYGGDIPTREIVALIATVRRETVEICAKKVEGWFSDADTNTRTVALRNPNQTLQYVADALRRLAAGKEKSHGG